MTFTNTQSAPTPTAGTRWYSNGYGFQTNNPDPQQATQIKLPSGQIQTVTRDMNGNAVFTNDPTSTLNWMQGWGFTYRSPTGNVNQATQINKGGTIYDVSGLPGNYTYTPATPSTGVNTADSSAKAIIDKALGDYGLASLSSWAWSKWQSGESIDQIMLELRDTPEYAKRFPAMKALSQSGRAISEAQYINYEQSAASIFKAAGLPSGFYDTPDDFAAFLTNDIGLPELQQRVQAYQTAMYQEPPEVRQALKDYYGLSDGDMTAYYIDPNKALPIIQQQNAAAAAGGWSQRAGFGNLTQAQAEDVGRLGLSDQQLAQQFGTLAQGNELYTGLVGSGESNIGKDVVLGAGFDQNAADQAIIDQRKRQRLATFSGGGQVATSQQGAVGAGTAR